MNRSSAMIAVFSAAAIGVYLTCPGMGAADKAILQQSQGAEAAGAVPAAAAVGAGGGYFRYGRSRSTAGTGVSSVHSGFGSAGARSASS